MNIPETDLPRIIVIGCGFAGLKFIKKVDTRQYQVVLFDENNYHTFQPLMYQVATAGLEPDSIVYPIRKVFAGKKNFYFRLSKVDKVNTEHKTVRTDLGELHYDHLIIATGATNNFFGMDDMEKNSLPMKTLLESLDIRSRVLQNFENALQTTDIQEREALMGFVIVGGGPTGVELAGALAELKRHVLPHDYPDLDVRRMQIHVVEASDRLLSNMSQHASEKSEAFLRKLGVNVWLKTKVEGYDGHTVRTDNKDLQARTLVWSAGVQGRPVDGVEVEKRKGNRLAVDDFARLRGMENVYAIGDVAAMSTEHYPDGHPMLASVAGQQGDWLAKNLNRLAQGKEEKPFTYNDKGTMATVGRNLAVVDLDKWKFSGLFAWLVWMSVHLMLLVDFRSRLVVFVNWVWSYFKYDRGARVIIRESRK
ncbi:MAG: NAD(P)/FAD-dependent oxidoreductase [Flavobacteriales bacterium]|nr:NAD(P)/FAD-dependent oxidoreductase [Flavobacteriales bacterium]